MSDGVGDVGKVGHSLLSSAPAAPVDRLVGLREDEQTARRKFAGLREMLRGKTVLSAGNGVLIAGFGAKRCGTASFVRGILFPLSVMQKAEAAEQIRFSMRAHPPTDGGFGSHASTRKEKRSSGARQPWPWGSSSDAKRRLEHQFLSIHWQAPSARLARNFRLP